MKFNDNTYYISPEIVSHGKVGYVVEPDVKEIVEGNSTSHTLNDYSRFLQPGWLKGECAAFLKILSSSTIQELNNEQSGGILVWPHSFNIGKDDLTKRKVLECTFDNEYKKIKTLSTNNLVGFVGKGKVQVEINTRFCSNKDKEQDYYLYYMLSKVFHLNIVNMEVGSGSLKELDLLIFMFPRLLQDAMRYTSSM